MLSIVHVWNVPTYAYLIVPQIEVCQPKCTHKSIRGQVVTMYKTYQEETHLKNYNIQYSVFFEHLKYMEEATTPGTLC